MSPAGFNKTLDELFPGSAIESQFMERAYHVLKAHGFNRDNSIACVAICRDEICDPFELEVIARFGPTFGMRGLGGLISCGNTGFGAAHAHSPVIEGKRRYIYFVAPHIAIDESGTVGTVQRPGIPCKSSACGALKAFAKEIEGGKVDLRLDFADIEQSMLKQAIAPKLDEMEVNLTRTGVVRKLDEMTLSDKKLNKAATDKKEEKKGGTLVELTKIASRVIARDQLTAHIDATVDTNEADYAIIAGIQIHGPEGRSYFCPDFESCVACVDGKVTQLRIKGIGRTFVPPKPPMVTRH